MTLKYRSHNFKCKRIMCKLIYGLKYSISWKITGKLYTYRNGATRDGDREKERKKESAKHWVKRNLWSHVELIRKKATSNDLLDAVRCISGLFFFFFSFCCFVDCINKFCKWNVIIVIHVRLKRYYSKACAKETKRRINSSEKETIRIILRK